VRRLAIALLIGSVLSLSGLARPAAAQSDTTTPAPAAPSDDSTAIATTLAPVDVLQVSGLFDEIIVNSIEQAIDRSAAAGSQALILQLNSGGAVVSRERMGELLDKVANAPIAIGVWVGQSRSARAYGLPAQLMAVADVTAMVPGSRIGYTGDLLSVNGKPVDFGAASGDLRSGSMAFQDARAAGVLKLTTTDEGVPTVRSMVAAMDGAEARGKTLDTVVHDNATAQGVSTLVRFNGLGLLDELMHTVASPEMAYLLFIIGMALLVFEFFTAGVGVAGVVGAVCFILGCYGLAALPTRPLAVAVMVLAMLAFAIDTQVGVPRFWTGVGIVLFVLGSWFLFRNLPGTNLRVGWLTLAVGIVGMVLTFVVGMPSMVRTRFATPTIGREWMLGMAGTAAATISPTGVAEVGGAKWRARTNRATPIAAGEALRVIGIDGVTLDVEPEDGAARDYRDRRATPDA